MEDAIYGNLEDYQNQAIYGNIGDFPINPSNKNNINNATIFEEQDELYGNIGSYSKPGHTGANTNTHHGQRRNVHINTNYNEETDTIYGNIEGNDNRHHEQRRNVHINTNRNKGENDEDDNAIYGNIGDRTNDNNLAKLLKLELEKEEIRRKQEQFLQEDEQVEYGNIGEFKENSNSDETIDEDDFDSDDDWDDSPEQIDYTRSFSTNVRLESIPLEQILKNEHTQNLKWTQIMERFQININHLTEKERNLQDAKYELISAEWSFFNALNILYGQFVQKLFIVISANESKKLFAYVKEVKDCSEKLLKNIETCWKNNLFSDNFCEVLCKNIENFDVYVHYCSNQIYSEAMLGEIVSDKSRLFNEFLNDIQCEPICKGLHLHAYQLIPVRKISNFPNLLENILRCLTPQNKEYHHCNTALYTTKQLVHRCNTEIKEAKEFIRTKTILEKLDFPKNSPLKLNQDGVHMRKFIKSDKMEITERSNTIFGKIKFIKKTVYVFLFNDIFVVAKKSSSNKYMVLDYCFRINLELDSNPVYLNLTVGSIDLDTVLYLHIRENRDLKPTEMILTCKTKTDAIRWIEALDPPDTSKTDQSFNYNFTRKVIVQRNYSACHSDEINLTIGEKYLIIRETDDGWSFGQKEKDGECGWFLTENVLLLDDVKQRVSNVKKKYQSSSQQH